MGLTSNKIPKEEHFFEYFVITVAQKMYPKVEQLFPLLNIHILSFSPNEVNHAFILIKQIIFCYSKIRFFNLAKKHTEVIQGTDVRKTLTKLILFNHQ